MIGAEADDSAGATLVQSIAAVLAGATKLTLIAAQHEGGNHFVVRNCTKLRAALNAAQQLIVAASGAGLRRHAGGCASAPAAHARMLRVRACARFAAPMCWAWLKP